LRGQSGTNLRGQSGTNLRSPSSGGNAIYESAAIGPVETVSFVGALAKITVLGQTYTSDSDTIADIALGDYVVIAGGRDRVASIVYRVGSTYVPGVSRVTVRGAVGAVDTAHATATVGNVVVDYVSHLANAPDYVPETGAVLEATGTQPQPGGAILVGSGDGAVVTQLNVRSVATQTSLVTSVELDSRL
jgi:hypothetical protein